MFYRIKDWLLNNKNLEQTIAKNTFWLFSGQIIGRFMRAVIVIYAARILGVASWGAFSYALGVAAFLTIFSDIGINALITKETSRNPKLKDQYISTAFFTKLGLLGVLMAVVIAFFPYLTNIDEAARIMPILIFVFAFDTLRDLGSSIARAIEKMQIEALIGIFTNLAIVLLGFAFLSINGTSLGLAFAYAFGSLLGLIAIFYTLRDHFKNIFTHFNKKLVKEIIATAWPFGLMGLMGAIMLNTDVIMLGWMRSAEEVGYYAAAQKPVQLLYVLPTLLATSIFPALARLSKTDPRVAKDILQKSVKMVLAAAIPLALGGMILAKPIISLVYGAEYLPAVWSFRILMATLVIVYPSTLIGNAIFAYDQQKSFVGFVAASTFGNIFFNALLIPIFGIAGAATSTLLTQILTNWLIWRKIKKLTGFSLIVTRSFCDIKKRGL